MTEVGACSGDVQLKVAVTQICRSGIKAVCCVTTAVVREQILWLPLNREAAPRVHPGSEFLFIYLFISFSRLSVELIRLTRSSTHSQRAATVMWRNREKDLQSVCCCSKNTCLRLYQVHLHQLLQCIFYFICRLTFRYFILFYSPSSRAVGFTF